MSQRHDALTLLNYRNLLTVHEPEAQRPDPVKLP